MDKIIKRNGQEATFIPQLISASIVAAAKDVMMITEDMENQLVEVGNRVVDDIKPLGNIVTNSIVQDAIVKRLINEGYTEIAESYLAYRIKRNMSKNGIKGKTITVKIA